jgi:hypothetical protein
MPKAHPGNQHNDLQPPQYPPPPETYYLPAQPPLPPTPPRKGMRHTNKIALAIIGSVVGIFVLVVVIIFAAGSTAQTVSLSQADQDATATAVAADVAATNVALQNSGSTGATVTLPTDTPISTGSTWTTTHTFTGNGSKQTETFTVPGDWKILYTCTFQDGGQVDGALSVEVYGTDNTIQDVAVNATCHNLKTTGETEEHQSGQIFLKMLGTGDWTVEVQELQ